MTATRPRRETIVFWSLSALLGLMFAFGGATKLLAVEMQVENFVRWGLPDWFRPVVGLVELAAAILLVVPRTRFYGSVLLVATMVGAILTHVVSGVDYQMVPVNVVVLILSGVLAWNYRPDLVKRLLPQKTAAQSD